MQANTHTYLSKKNGLLAIILLLLTHLFWAGNIYVSKIASDHIPPLLLNCLRWLGAALLLTPFAIKTIIKERQAIKQSIAVLCFFGFLGVTLYNSLLYVSAHTSSGINIAVISTLTPLCTFIFAWLLYKQTPNKNQVLGFCLGILGVLTLIFQANLSRLLQLEFSIGDLWMLIAVIAWAIYTVTLPNNKPKVSAITFLYCTIILGVIIALPSAWWEYQQGNRWQIQTSDKWLISYICIFPSLLSYLFYNYGVATIGAIKTVMFSYLLPVFTAVISIFWLKEPLAAYHIIGQLLVITGFYFSVLK